MFNFKLCATWDAVCKKYNLLSPMLQKYLICYAFLKREGFKKKMEWWGDKSNRKRFGQSVPPFFALNPVGTRPGGIFRNVWNFPAVFCEAAADWRHPFCSETGNGIISRLRFYNCFIYCQSVIKFCTMLFLSHHVYNGIIFILGDPISYAMFPVVNSERSDWVRNLPFESTN